MSQPANILVKEIDATPRVRDALPGMAANPVLAELMDLPVPAALKPAVAPEAFVHRNFRDDEFWRQIPGYADVDRATFLDWKFQNKQSVTSLDKLAAVLGNLVSPAFLDDVRAGIVRAPMNVRISPYVVALTNWADPYRDPLRVQFLPVASTQLPDHPRLTLDSLHEQADAPTPGLTHRYYDKALFLPLDVCPVYCRFCTRSYAIGGDTDTVQKASLKPDPKRWHSAIAYIASRPEIEDIVVSGGDLYMLPAKHLSTIGHLLLAIPHIRRIRIATKGPAVSPMKILTDEAWTNALFEVANAGRRVDDPAPEDRRHDMAGEDAGVTGTQGAGGVDEVEGHRLEDQRADQAEERRGRGEPDRCHHAAEPGAEEADQHDGQDQRRERQHRVAERRDGAVERPPEVAGHEAERERQDHRQGDPQHDEREVGAGRGQHPAPDVPAQLVGPEPPRRRRRLHELR